MWFLSKAELTRGGASGMSAGAAPIHRSAGRRISLHWNVILSVGVSGEAGNDHRGQPTPPCPLLAGPPAPHTGPGLSHTGLTVAGLSSLGRVRPGSRCLAQKRGLLGLELKKGLWKCWEKVQPLSSAAQGGPKTHVCILPSAFTLPHCISVPIAAIQRGCFYLRYTSVAWPPFIHEVISFQHHPMSLSFIAWHKHKTSYKKKKKKSQNHMILHQINQLHLPQLYCTASYTIKTTLKFALEG